MGILMYVMNGGQLVGLICAVSGILCGIIGVISNAIVEGKKNQSEARVKPAIIEKGVSLDTMKELFPEPKKSKKYASLHWGFILLGLGLGYLLYLFAGMNGDTSFIFTLSLGMGLGLIVSFFIRRKFEIKDEERERNINQ